MNSGFGNVNLGIRRAATIAFLMAGTTVSLSAQTVISTTGGGAPVGPFGKPTAQTFGQTITAPGNSVLQSFTFYLSPAGSLVFKAYVFPWDPIAARATGSALFTSAPIIGPIGSGFIPVTVFVGSGIPLDPGSMYTLFFSSSGQSEIGEAAVLSTFDSPAANQYSGGAFVYINNGENTGAWTTQPWSTDRQGPGSDIRFQAVFVAAPEPSTFVLVAVGLMGICLVSRRAWKRVSAARP